MIAYTPSKINIGLKVLNKRLDGYHNIDSIFYPIPLNDIMEITKSSHTTITNTGLIVDCPLESNLIYKAWKLLNDDYKIGGVKIHLHKVVPMGAGIGGGSSNAVSALRIISSLYKLDISEELMFKYACQLGSDCPFFLYQQPLHAQGIGYEFSEVSINLKGFFIVLIKPELHMATSLAYQGVQYEGEQNFLVLNTISDLDSWKHCFPNSFEKHIFELYPLLSELKQSLYAQGAFYASMSGSGSTIYGLFRSKPSIMKSWENHFCWIKEL